MKKLLTILLISSWPITAFSQMEATQYFMNALPQVTNSNPAFIPKYKFSIGFPGISSIATTYSNNGFSYNNLIKHSNGETVADLDKWNKALTKKNYITSTSQLDLFRVGFKVGPRLYFQVGSTAKEYARFLIPKEATSLLVQGTTPVVGTTQRFSPQVEALAHIESYVIGALKFNDKLTLGVRLKYLVGMINATTINSDVTVAVADDYQLNATAGFLVKTSGYYDAQHTSYRFHSQFKNYFKNSGAGIDLGATYQLTSRITFAASIIDLGRISWKNNLYAYTLDPATAHYTFNGIEANKLVQGNSSYLSQQRDSIEKNFKPQHTPTGSYSTWLPGKVYVSGSYLLATNLRAGLVLFTEKFQGRFSQGITASMNKNIGRIVSTSFSYTVANRSFNNIGAGVSFNLTPVQIYLVGDNLLNAPISLISNPNLNSYINNTQVFSLRAGVNFVWGWDKETDKRPRNPHMAKTPKKANVRIIDIRQKKKKK